MTDFSALENPVLRRAADAKAITTVQTALGFALPTVLHTLLSESDGWSDDTGLLFYGTAELAERNGAWEVATYAPSYVAVADDGGGRVALVMKDSSSSAVVVTDSGDMDPADFRALDSDAIAWVERGCPFNVPAAPGSGIPAHSLVDVLPVHPLPNGVKDLVVIRATPVMSQNYSREWTTEFEREKQYFENMLEPFEDWQDCRAPEGEAESYLSDGLVILYAGGPIPLAQRFLKAAIEVASRAFREGKIATSSPESIGRPFPRDRARALRALNYSKALLGETGGLDEGLRDASRDYWAWCEGYGAGDWDSQAEAYLLASVRLALAAGEPLRAGDLLEKRSSYTWHARESALLRRVVELALLRQVWSDELRNAYREYFDIVRAPDYRPSIFFETAIARFELGAILVGYCEGQTAEIDWRKVLRVVAD